MSIYIPTQEKKILSKNHIVFEKSYTPINDQFLLEKGIDITAITEFKEGKIKNRVEFSRNDIRRHINCIHAVIGEVLINEHGETEIKNISLERKKEFISSLSLETHWFSLKSYIEGLIEFGIENCLIETLNNQIDPSIDDFSFNHFFQYKLLDVLRVFVPNFVNKHLFALLNSFKNSPQMLRMFIHRHWSHIWKDFREIIFNEPLSPELAKAILADRHLILPPTFKETYKKEWNEVQEEWRKKRGRSRR